MNDHTFLSSKKNSNIWAEPLPTNIMLSDMKIKKPTGNISVSSLVKWNVDNLHKSYNNIVQRVCIILVYLMENQIKTFLQHWTMMGRGGIYLFIRTYSTVYINRPTTLKKWKIIMFAGLNKKTQAANYFFMIWYGNARVLVTVHKSEWHSSICRHFITLRLQL